MTIWTNVKIDPELREFITLSGKDIGDLSIVAAHKPDPDAWLAEELNRRGREKRDLVEAEYAKRRERDKAFVQQLNDSWPDTVCCMKEQPWVKSTSRRFGTIKAEDVIAGRWVIYINGEGEQTFESLDALVEVWSVD